MSKWKLLAAALGIFVVHAVASAGNAQAQVIIQSPWGAGVGINAYVGMSGGVAKAVLVNRSTSACAFSILGTSAGLTNNFEIFGTSTTDFLIVVGGLAPRYDVCGTSVFPLVYNGHFLDVNGAGGDDFVFNGTGDSYALGGDGNDTVETFSGIGIGSGGNGNDRVFGTSAVSNDRLFGDAGDDCLQDFGNTAATFDCGTQTVHDFYVSPATGTVSCEVAVSGC
jgi:Ca2+-binding RTX toxin-like protein